MCATTTGFSGVTSSLARCFVGDSREADVADERLLEADRALTLPPLGVRSVSGKPSSVLLGRRRLLGGVASHSSFTSAVDVVDVGICRRRFERRRLGGRSRSSPSATVGSMH
jgi:hypothetical protein